MHDLKNSKSSGSTVVTKFENPPDQCGTGRSRNLIQLILDFGYMPFRNSVEFFRSGYRQLAGHPEPFPWQKDLFLRFCAGDIPEILDLPTGAGKTSVIVVWLLALANQTLESPVRLSLPRRIVWVVDRRVVVDQATQEAERLTLQLSQPTGELKEISGTLATLSLSGEDGGKPVAVSTLRGELADNEEWSRDPSRPAIIIGTVDMIGSRLLFSGYGDSRRRRALHAALLGQDALVVNDEAHLTPAFANLLMRIRDFTGVQRPIRTMLLSATHRYDTTCAFPTDIEADTGNEVFRKRYCSVKRLHLCEHDDAKKEIQRLSTVPDRRTIVFVRSPEDARKIAASTEAKNAGTSIPLLTGTQRGWERDQLLRHDALKPFLAKDAPPANAAASWMVATSAGEVGIDLSADRLITDLDSADHLLQRFGRLNRFGETEGDAYVVYSPKQINGETADAQRLKATLDYLKTLPDVSPKTLRTTVPPTAALSATPRFAQLLPWHLDVWSMTSISAAEWPSRPAVEEWIRGHDELPTPSETYVAWREDVADLVKPGISQGDREEVFECYPVLAQERLKQYTHKLCDELEQSNYHAVNVIFIGADGEISVQTIAELLKERRLLRYATLILPPGTGHLDRHGMVDWLTSTEGLSQKERERYDKSATENRKRELLGFEEASAQTELRLRYTVQVPTEDENAEGPRWAYFVGRRNPAPAKRVEMLLSEHQKQAGTIVGTLARRLGFDERTTRVFEWAASHHDAGKARGIWQRAAGNIETSDPLAKCQHLNAWTLDGYRHELGSLLDAEMQLPPDFSDAERDLALHLIASHHGWARPHFARRAFDKEAYRRSERAALECARRFGLLQQQYGAYTLAYLEVILRSADAIASKDVPELPANA